jgi:hypothetical protein
MIVPNIDGNLLIIFRYNRYRRSFAYKTYNESFTQGRLSSLELSHFLKQIEKIIQTRRFRKSLLKVMIVYIVFMVIDLALVVSLSLTIRNQSHLAIFLSCFITMLIASCITFFLWLRITTRRGLRSQRIKNEAQAFINRLNAS